MRAGHVERPRPGPTSRHRSAHRTEDVRIRLADLERTRPAQDDERRLIWLWALHQPSDEITFGSDLLRVGQVEAGIQREACSPPPATPPMLVYQPQAASDLGSLTEREQPDIPCGGGGLLLRVSMGRSVAPSTDRMAVATL